MPDKQSIPRRIGTLFRVPLADETYGYAWLMKRPNMAFLRYNSSRPEADLDTLKTIPFAFVIPVRLRPADRWEAIGWCELPPELQAYPTQFRQPVGNFRECYITDNFGNERIATPEECVGIERAAVWDGWQASERLLDELRGRTNRHAEHLKVRFSDDRP
ncbi:MAG: hypothetical protein K8W52_23585 [Deltaproteobacteria bacterium]|nr:hypothetical protein [Deltaproteobacteria bacterium]